MIGWITATMLSACGGISLLPSADLLLQSQPEKSLAISQSAQKAPPSKLRTCRVQKQKQTRGNSWDR